MARQLNACHFPALEEDPFRSREFLPDADQILTLEREIEIAREAVRETVVGGFIALEALGVLRHVKRRSRGQKHDGEPHRGHRAQVSVKGSHRLATRRSTH